MAGKRPGGVLSTRPLNFFWIVDCSGSMALENRMDSVNSSIAKALPAMREAADSNPNAQVFVQTLRFSDTAKWIQPEPVLLDSFEWQNLFADELPQTVEFSSEFRKRLQREGAQGGDIQISLMWNNYNDLDLHVVTPSNETIYFGHKNSECGGELDVDMNVSPESNEPVENVFWPPGGSPNGHFQVYVNHYKNHRKSGCDDPTRFKVAINVGGHVTEFDGSITYGNPKLLVHEFDNDGTIAVDASQTGSGNTNLGNALTKLSQQLRIPPMSDRALPPVLVLISDGIPTDDFKEGIQKVMEQPWGTKAIRLAIAIGQDVDTEALNAFIDNENIPVLQANNPESLVEYINWASTVAVQASSSPVVQGGGDSSSHAALPAPPKPNVEVGDVW